MDAIFLLAGIVFSVALIVGLVRPSWVVHWGAPPTRGRVLLVYGILALAAGLLFVQERGLVGSADVVRHPADLVGHWEGLTRSARPGDSTGFPLSLEVRSDGQIRGRVGDATVERGTVWRAALTRRWFGGETHVFQLLLKGPFEEGASRTAMSARLMLKHVRTHLRGTLQLETVEPGPGARPRRSTVGVELERI